MFLSMNEKKQKTSGFNVYLLVGVVLTIAWFWFAAHYASIKIDAVADLKLNLLGDFIAGFIAPVTVIWLVLGYFLQIKELQNTVRELQQSVDAQNRQAQSVEANTAHVQRDVFLQLAGQIIEQLDADVAGFLKHQNPDILRTSGAATFSANVVIKECAIYLTVQRASVVEWLHRQGPEGNHWPSKFLASYKKHYEFLLKEAELADKTSTLKSFYEQSAYGDVYRAIESL